MNLCELHCPNCFSENIKPDYKYNRLRTWQSMNKIQRRIEKFTKQFEKASYPKREALYFAFSAKLEKNAAFQQPQLFVVCCKSLVYARHGRELMG